MQAKSADGVFKPELDPLTIRQSGVARQCASPAKDGDTTALRRNAL